jgi:acetyl-CoA carboxylase carboxyl transferase subunit beta
LPEGFQTSEYLLENGFLDFIVNRKDLREALGDLLAFFDKVETDFQEIVTA